MSYVCIYLFVGWMGEWLLDWLIDRLVGLSGWWAWAEVLVSIHPSINTLCPFAVDQHDCFESLCIVS